MKVILSPLAKSDFREIVQWIAADSVRNAEAFAEKLASKMGSLDEMGLRHALIGRGDLRRLTYRGYHIFYRVNDFVEVARIVYGARDWTSMIGDSD